MSIPRQEYPRPQFVREKWKNLNGSWNFAYDTGDGLKNAGSITVPFCPESKLSGIGDTRFIYTVRYEREFELASDEVAGRVLLHFGACDYLTQVFVNGKPAGTHRGGYTSFCFDITSFVHEGTNVLTVTADDDTAGGRQPSGKQSQRNESHGCYYTRTTGIWQTVWLEFVPESYVVRAKYITDIKNGSVSIDADCICGEGAVLECQVSFDGTAVASGSASVCSGHAKLTLPIPDPKLWEPGNGRLYDLELCLGEDVVKSYFGMRSVSVSDGKMLINGKKVFQRLVLDQGFYPDGIYTAPDDAALENDIKLSMALGFNGARLHQKVFEERFLTYCDKMGYIVWGEYPNWGMSPDVEHDGFTDEWLESVRRDFNHPSVIGWCPFNETERDFDKALVRHVVEATQNSDPTRPVIDTSGWFHSGSGDILDTHDYDQNPESFKNRYDRLVDEGETQSAFPGDTGHFTFVSEYGGIGWSSDGGWGYGDMPKTKDELLERYRGLTDALLDNPELFGFCYTQLTDVEQERNGLYTYDRKPKFDCELIRRINQRRAAYEDE